MIKNKDILEMGERAVKASRELALLSSRKKNSILEGMADELEARKIEIQTANRKDLEEGAREGLSKAMLDRLSLTDERFDGMVKGIHDVIALKDPVGDVLSSWVRPNGLEIRKVRVPIGVIAIIYESRPNVTVDAAVLCFKSSNATILRGGKEAVHSNRALALAIQEGGEKKGLPKNAVQLVQTTNRAAVKDLVQLDGMVDLVIPRGGESLIRAVSEQATVPVIKHYKGVCHIFVDKSADLAKAVEIIDNAKTQRPGVCNSVETVLVHKNVAEEFLPMMANRLIAKNVVIRGCETTRRHIPEAEPATEADWGEEYLDLILSVKVVDSVDEATTHINTYGSRHSDAILSETETAQKKFLQEVDSSTVYVNASTRFTDGNAFGLGAEIGISTDKLHARGPMGLEELTTYKYHVLGTGQVR
ncbi:MAG: glutamate-5-semialdehyde dehydrogenase [Verrucomicrobia bacterium]|nr:glutamate-5-semialdehyde dehydrogenase [Verrucomicrobiota bacterium]MCH8510182.1 glutamate-5-semialdehyde dehydrogenase [Kiritimatiellia bacterium]